MLGTLENAMKHDIRQKLTSSLLKYFGSDLSIDLSAVSGSEGGSSVETSFFRLLLDLLEGPALSILTQTKYWSPLAPLVQFGDFKNSQSSTASLYATYLPDFNRINSINSSLLGG